MNRGGYYFLVIMLLSIILLSACSDNPERNLVDEFPTEEIPSQEVPDQVVIPDEFYNLPSEMIVPPNHVLDLLIDGATYRSENPSLLELNHEGKPQVAADAITGEFTMLTVSIADQQKEILVKVKYALSDTIEDVNGVATITNPADILVLVNKERSLPADYVPEGLMAPEIPFYFSENIEKRWLRPEAAKAIEEMFAKAKEDGIHMFGASAYRSYKTQEALFSRYVGTHGEEEAARFSARAGQSEHQTGLTIDVYHANITNGLEEAFADTPEGQWVAENAHQFGFVIRYPKDKEEITGYSFEPWHLRYVGTNVANELYKKNITLEEYFLEENFYTFK